MIALLVVLVVQQPAASPWTAVATALGKPAPAAGETYRATFPRSDLHVRVGGVAVEPALALTSWAGFEGAGDSTEVMGDLVLLESEVPAVMSGLLDAGIDVTAVHHHLLGETPRVFYMHFHGRGAGPDLATKLKAALSKSATPLGIAATAAPATTLDTTTLFATLGVHGRLAGDVVQISVPTSGSHATMDGHPIPAALGMNTAINIQPVGMRGGRAVTTGDFVLSGDKVEGVLRALTAAGIRPTAVHNHMIGEEPRAFFVHFWGEGEPGSLAKSLKSALDAAR